MKKYQTKVKAPFKTRSGLSFTIGTPAEIYWLASDSQNAATVEIAGHTIKLRSARLYQKFQGFMEPPTVRAMSNWDDKGYCKTILNHKTEPDGTGTYGEPSWMLALGYL